MNDQRFWVTFWWTYIYGMFYRFEMIDVPDEVKEKKNDRVNKKQKKHQKV